MGVAPGTHGPGTAQGDLQAVPKALDVVALDDDTRAPAVTTPMVQVLPLLRRRHTGAL